MTRHAIPSIWHHAERLSRKASLKQAAASALGQLGTSHPDVVPALLKTLSDSDWLVRQEAARALTTLQISHMAIGQDIEGLLLQSKPLTDKQFEVDRTVDALFFTLWQFISGGA